MNKVLADRTKFKTILVTDLTNCRTTKFDKVTVRDSNEFLDSNGKPQFFIIDKEVGGVKDTSYYPYNLFSWKEFNKEKPDIETVIKNITKDIEALEAKGYSMPLAIAVADLNAILDELARLYSVNEMLQSLYKTSNSEIDALEGMLNELRAENKELKDGLNEKK